ncbi:uncharacterized protein AMSG_05435 [Thecamonas trahens ATCC 50062]|uniref:Uncharacterized protein n=1 Tax=Thecamonas trahens ATCC 50062 TaxID=461836 RepID=A0A0L0DAP4_THETB|nr:hypothetical protein AMSG_05435 [Thecamonas trahens ATCC 50062]KNC49429.1 hypothetical protein AMSG_05435 [Thecamonas trahens ATCC 50062]|eukprot:XP_013757851.1 hypothetical protein AMSG_05435 [Thecamonas trahens ATCC 50062]
MLLPLPRPKPDLFLPVLAFFTVFAVLTAATTASSPRTCAPWASTFTIAFVSGIPATTSTGAGDAIEVIDDAASAVNTGMMYYDYPTRAVRIDHGPGAHECIRFYNTSAACTEYFLPRGMVIDLPHQRSCCLSVPGVGPNPPDWTAVLDYVGSATIDGVAADQWLYGRHGYWNEVAPAGNPAIPLRFSFPNATQDYWFSPHSYSTKPIPASVFTLPPYCTLDPSSHPFLS